MCCLGLNQLIEAGGSSGDNPYSSRVGGKPGKESRLPLQCSSASHIGDGGGIGKYNANKGVGLSFTEVDGLVAGVSSACCGGRMGFPGVAIAAVDSQFQYLHRTSVGSGGAVHSVVFGLTTAPEGGAGSPSGPWSGAAPRSIPSLQLNCQPLRTLCQISSYGSSGSGHGGTSFPPADLGYRLVQTQCWGPEQLTSGQRAAITVSEGSSLESMPYYNDPSVRQ